MAQQFYSLKKLNFITYTGVEGIPHHKGGIGSFLYPHVGPRNQIQVGRLGSPHSYLTSYPAGPGFLYVESQASLTATEALFHQN